MNQTTLAVSGRPRMSNFQLKTSARGALIRSFFASALTYWAVVLSGHMTPMRFSIATVLSVGLISWTILSIRATRNLPGSAAELDHWKSVRKFYWLDVGLEWALIGAAMLALVRFHRFDLAVQACGVIVGLHYLPLGKIFRARQYYWTGEVLVFSALGSLLVPRGHIRDIAGCAAVGLTLWVTCIALLYWIASELNGRDKDATNSAPEVC